MYIGVPKEIKNHEYRVGLTPESVAELVTNGHAVLSKPGRVWASVRMTTRIVLPGRRSLQMQPRCLPTPK